MMRMKFYWLWLKSWAISHNTSVVQTLHICSWLPWKLWRPLKKPSLEIRYFLCVRAVLVLISTSFEVVYIAYTTQLPFPYCYRRVSCK